MALTFGTRLGVFEISAQIGDGGMGAVYRATDTSLSRQVAIKVLPDAFAADADRLARFEREAKTLASLNHPHIAAIYAIEKSAGITALVMELVEGDDLSERIAHLRASGASAGQAGLPLDEALPIARQIAEALEAAHEQGIIHRDLKPANIKVRSDGTVKVLDFGLAKAMEGPGQAGLAGGPGGNDLADSPTITTPAHLRQGYGGQAMTQPMARASRTRLAAATTTTCIRPTPTETAGRQTALLESADSKFPNSWSRDHYLIYGSTGASTGQDLWLLPPTGKPFPFLASPAREFDARFSPDGRWIAYLSDESGAVELYARSFTPAAGAGPPAIGLRVPVSSRGARMPRWRGDGRELFFVAPNGDLMSVAITEIAASASAPTLQVGRPARLFPAPSPGNWDAAPDGQRFLCAIPVGARAMAPFTVVVNWQTPSPVPSGAPGTTKSVIMTP